MKDPAFLFYPNDYIGGTMGMTFEEKGAYMELLMMQFNRGHMTSHMIGQVVGQLWDNIKHKFKQDNEGLWYNERLDLEKENRIKFTQSRRNNLNGINQYTKKGGHKGGHMDGHMTSHMENENENENINKNIDNIKNIFNEICIDLPKVEVLNDNRKKAIKGRLKEYGPEKIEQVFRMAQESDFICGRATDWRGTFDWVMTPKYFPRILEGQYNNRKENKNMDADENFQFNG
jgi:uncharacterized protein YdaU (DUF1376 family)